MDQGIIELARSTAITLVERLQVADQSRGEDGRGDLFRMAVKSALDQAMDLLSRSRLWGPANQMPSNEFWRIAESWLVHGDLQLHARTKPRGYAGDFDLLRKICGTICCEHRVGHAMDHYFQDQAAPRAVRERTELVTRRLIERCQRAAAEPVHIVSVGSGPAVELQALVRQASPDLRCRLRTTLIDIDQQALDFASRELTPLVGENLTALRANLSRLSQNAKLMASMSAADYLFCPGFFDYLDDNSAAEMLRLFYDNLAPGGELTVFNFSPDNASRAYMEWIGNWYLTYRDRSAMLQLGDRLGIPDPIEARELTNGTLVELTIRRR